MWVPLTCLLVDDSTVAADLQNITVVALVRRHELYAAVAMPMVVPINKRHHPLASGLPACKWMTWLVRPVFRSPEQRLGVGIFIGDPQQRKGSEHAQLFQPAFEHGCTYGVSVIGMENQWLLPALAHSFSQATPADQIRCNGWVFPFDDIPGHHLAAPDVDH